MQSGHDQPAGFAQISLKPLTAGVSFGFDALPGFAAPQAGHATCSGLFWHRHSGQDQPVFFQTSANPTDAGCGVLSNSLVTVAGGSDRSGCLCADSEIRFSRFCWVNLSPPQRSHLPLDPWLSLSQRLQLHISLTISTSSAAFEVAVCNSSTWTVISLLPREDDFD